MEEKSSEELGVQHICAEKQTAHMRGKFESQICIDKYMWYQFEIHIVKTLSRNVTHFVTPIVTHIANCGKDFLIVKKSNQI